MVASVLLMLAGIGFLVAAFIEQSGKPEVVTPTDPFDLRTPTSANTPTFTATPVPDAPTPTPTPTPFDGKVARIIAPTIGLDHGIEEIGVTNGQLDVPVDGVNKVGWYSIYEQPGHGKNSLFAAHINFNRHDGPFAHLAEIHKLEHISIVMEGGPTYVYEVIFYRRYDLTTIAMGELIDANDRPPNEEWITLITCGGDFVPDPGSEFGHYLQRDVVIARRIE
ncbi:MAG: class F sortase [Dehalococcoidia bacterium]